MATHQALYRRYRPKRFGDVVGQEAVTLPLRQAIKSERISHAYLFSGPRGTGKTSVARIFAKAANCSHPEDGEPCLHCASCEAVDTGAHLDVLEIDAASNRGIDEIRDIRDRILHLPVMGRYKVYIIDEVHMLTTEAFNALLKTLEEPPPHVLFLMATTESHKLPLTVLSRCQRYAFGRLPVPVIRERLRTVLQEEGEQWEEAALELLAEAGDGALRDALSLTDQARALSDMGEVRLDTVRQMLGALDGTRLADLFTAMATQDLGSMVQVLEGLYQEGGDPRQLLRDMARLLRDVLLYHRVGIEALPQYRREAVAAVAGRVSGDVVAARWFDALDILAQAESRLRGAFPQELVMELALFQSARCLVAAAPVPAPDGDSGEEAPLVAADGEAAGRTEAPSPESTDAWSRVLELVRHRRMTTWALLKPAEVAWDAGRLLVRFLYPSHVEILEQAENRQVFDAALKEVYGHEVTVVVSATSDPPAKEPGSSLKKRVQDLLGDDIEIQGIE